MSKLKNLIGLTICATAAFFMYLGMKMISEDKAKLAVMGRIAEVGRFAEQIKDGWNF